jgi:putative tryptophan/tyrosine transport system substrate-binding protein
MRRREFIARLGGAALMRPTVGWAQQPTVPLIGYLGSTTEGSARKSIVAFRQGLGEQGYFEGRNVQVIYRWAEAQYDRMPALAADLVGRRVAVLVATGAQTPYAAKAATTTIPIVFSYGGDPVGTGLVASLNRPGGNITGTTFFATELVAKRLQKLHEMVPAATVIGFLNNPALPGNEGQIKEVNDAARALGVHLVILNASTSEEIEFAFVTLVRQQISTLLVVADPLFFARRDQLATLTARHSVAAIYESRDQVEAGGLMSFGTRIEDAVRAAGLYVGRILKGENPADLPVVRPTKFELVINLRTAKALGLTIPEPLLATADEVIE